MTEEAKDACYLQPYEERTQQCRDDLAEHQAAHRATTTRPRPATNTGVFNADCDRAIELDLYAAAAIIRAGGTRIEDATFARSLRECGSDTEWIRHIVLGAEQTANGCIDAITTIRIFAPAGSKLHQLTGQASRQC